MAHGTRHTRGIVQAEGEKRMSELTYTVVRASALVAHTFLKYRITLTGTVGSVAAVGYLKSQFWRRRRRLVGIWTA